MTNFKKVSTTTLCCRLKQSLEVGGKNLSTNELANFYLDMLIDRGIYNRKKGDKLIFVNATDNKYGEEHLYSVIIMSENKDLCAAFNYAHDLSYEVIENNEHLMKAIHKEAIELDMEEGSIDYNNFIQDTIQDYIAYSLYEIIIEFDTIEHMEQYAKKYPEDFIKKYCKII